MSESTNVKYICSIFIVFGAMYGFGNFGLLNLFDFRFPFQILYLIFSTFFFLIIVNNNIQVKEIILPTTFFFALAIIAISENETSKVWLHCIIMLMTYFTIIKLNEDRALNLIKIFLLLSVFFSILILIAYFFLLSNVDVYYSQLNYNIYDGTSGNKSIYPNHFIEWFSFTSGDAFYIFNSFTPRMKGYSSEPSSTIVYYLGPIAFAFLFSGRFKFLGLILLFTNLFSIASLIGHMILLFALGIAITYVLFKNYLKFFYYTYIFLFFLILMNFENLIEIMKIFNTYFQESYDLICRKINFDDDFSTKTSFTDRYFGFINGLQNTLKYPLGYDTSLLGPGPGLLFVISQKLGYFGVIIFLLFMYKIINKVIYVFKYYKLDFYQIYGLSIILSIIFFVSFISGYGWEKPAGLIIFMLFIKFLDIILKRIKNTHQQTQTNDI